MSRSLNSSLFFYQGGKRVTVKEGEQHHTIFRSAEMPLAEQQTGGIRGNGLLATDDKGSVLHVSGDEEEEQHAYTSYGHDPTRPSPLTLLGFNGEHYDQVTNGMLLGNGYRAYNATIMRFTSPDSWGPFSTAGLNTYCYCRGDPVNQIDPSGHISLPMLAKTIYKFLGLRRRAVTSHGTNGKMTKLVTFVPRRNRPVASIEPTSRPVTMTPPAVHAALAPSDIPRVATNGRSVQNLSAVEQPQSRPQTRVQPSSDARSSPAARARHYSSDTSSSADSSTDSTPPSSGSDSPSALNNLPDFVQHALDLRESRYNSRRFE
jgi:RHS repeat-associated protein